MKIVGTMNQFTQIWAVCLLGASAVMAMEQKNLGGPCGAGPSRRVFATKLYEEERFLGPGDLSPRSEHERFYRDIRASRRLGPIDCDDAQYRLALLCLSKVRAARDVIPLLLEEVSEFAEPFDEMTVVRNMVTHFFSNRPDFDDMKKRKLLQTIALAGDLFQPRILADVKQKLAFAILNGPGKYHDGEKVMRLFQEALDSHELGAEKKERIGQLVEQLKAINAERLALERIVEENLPDKKLLAYAQYKLATRYVYGHGLSQDNLRATVLLQRALASGRLGEAQKKDAEIYLAICSREKVQKDLEVLIAHGTLSPRDLASKQYLLAVACMHDRDECGDQKARFLLGKCVDSGNLSACDDAYARYYLACLYDEHRGRQKVVDDEHPRDTDELDDDNARWLLERLVESEFLQEGDLACAQCMLARLLISKSRGFANERAANLLKSVIRYLSAPQLILAEVLLNLPFICRSAVPAHLIDMCKRHHAVREQLAVDECKLKLAAERGLDWVASLLRIHDQRDILNEEIERLSPEFYRISERIEAIKKCVFALHFEAMDGAILDDDYERALKKMTGELPEVLPVSEREMLSVTTLERLIPMTKMGE